MGAGDEADRDSTKGPTQQRVCGAEQELSDTGQRTCQGSACTDPTCAGKCTSKNQGAGVCHAWAAPTTRGIGLGWIKTEDGPDAY